MILVCTRDEYNNRSVIFDFEGRMAAKMMVLSEPMLSPVKLITQCGKTMDVSRSKSSSFPHSYYKELVRKPGKLQRNKQTSKYLSLKVHDPAQSFVL